jgi:hypothetical protein
MIVCVDELFHATSLHLRAKRHSRRDLFRLILDSFIGTLLFLVIDPNVAANLPVVMTDLPVALLGINLQGSFGGTDSLPTLS